MVTAIKPDGSTPTETQLKLAISEPEHSRTAIESWIESITVGMVGALLTMDMHPEPWLVDLLAGQQLNRCGETQATKAKIRTSVCELVQEYFDKFLDVPYYYEGAPPTEPRRELGVLMQEVSTGTVIDFLITLEPPPEHVVNRMLRFGSESCGDGFIGVRLCWLQQPEASVLLSKDGLVSSGSSLRRVVLQREAARGQ